MKIKKVTLLEAEYSAHALAQKLFSEHNKHEPMPPFSSRYRGRLESCLEAPFQSFGGEPKYRFLVQKAANLFYLIIKNHPFENGNKRMAVMITLWFFYKNKKWLEVPPSALYGIACKVANSKPEEKEIHQRALEEFFKDHLTSLGSR